MSVRFDSATDDVIRAAYPLPLVTVTICMWFKPTWAQSDGGDHAFFSIDDGSGTKFLTAQKYIDGQIFCGLYNVVEQRIIIPSANYTINQNQWNVAIYNFDAVAGLEELRLNGTLIGNRVGALTVPDLSAETFHFGNTRSGSEDLRGDAWNPMIFARVLSANDRSIYEAGGHPANPLTWLKFNGDTQDSAPGARHFTGVNITFAANPPVGPANLAIVSATATTETLSWDQYSTTQLADTSLAVDYSTSSIFAGALTATGIDVTSTGVTIGGLTPNTVYYFRVRAVNAENGLLTTNWSNTAVGPTQVSIFKAGVVCLSRMFGFDFGF